MRLITNKITVKEKGWKTLRLDMDFVNDELFSGLSARVRNTARLRDSSLNGNS
jgi:hypothetical protein